MIAKRWFLILAIVLLCGASSLLYWRYSVSATPPLPPDPKAEDLEPLVAFSVRTKRDRVLQEPKSAVAWGELGEVFLANEMAVEARTCFVEAARLDTEDPRWPYLQGVILVNDGDREESLSHFQRAIDLSKNDSKVNPVAHLVLAETMLYLGMAKEAETHIHLVHERSPNDPRVRYDAGLLAIAFGDWETARGDLSLCLDSPYSRKKARIQLAAVCGRLKDSARAEGLQKELEQMPTDWDWPDPIVEEYMSKALRKRNSFNIAESLESQGRFEEAAQIASGVVENYPDDDVAQAYLGRLLAQSPQQGDLRSAERALLQAVRLAPQKVNPHYILSLILIRQGEILLRNNKTQAESKFQGAAKEASEAIAIKPDYGFAHMALGLALKHLGKIQAAEKELREAVRCSPEYADMHFQLAEMLLELDRKDEARSRYDQALKLAPPGTRWITSARSRLSELRKSEKKAGN
jgi:tetratricopeptide (TPR) repeat protein